MGLIVVNVTDILLEPFRKLPSMMQVWKKKLVILLKAKQEDKCKEHFMRLLKMESHYASELFTIRSGSYH